MPIRRITAGRGEKSFICRYDDAIGAVMPDWPADATREQKIAYMVEHTETVRNADQLAGVADKDLKDFASGVMTREAVLYQLRTNDTSKLPIKDGQKPYIWWFKPLSGPQFVNYEEIFQAPTAAETYRGCIDLMANALVRVDNWDEEIDGPNPLDQQGSKRREALENALPVDWALEIAETIFDAANLSAQTKKA